MLSPCRNAELPDTGIARSEGGVKGSVGVWHEGVCVMLRRRASLSSADQAATRRMVQGVFRKVVTTQGKGLGEVLLCTHFTFSPQDTGALADCSCPGSQEAAAQGWHVIVVPMSSPYSMMLVPKLVCDEHARSESQVLCV